MCFKILVIEVEISCGLRLNLDNSCLTFSALNLCNNVSEHQTLDLIRIIVAGLKCNNDDKNSVEFKALASIIFAYLVPRVQVSLPIDGHSCRNILGPQKHALTIC